jgi:hypothetical protein
LFAQLPFTKTSGRLFGWNAPPKKDFACVTCNFLASFSSFVPKRGVHNLFFLQGQNSCLVHSVECPSTSIIDSFFLFENNREIVKFIKNNPPNSRLPNRKVQELLAAQNYTTILDQTTISCGLDRMRGKHLFELGEAYSMLPSYLREYHKSNPEALVAMQLDDLDCFFLLVITLPSFVHIFQELCLPILHVDGAHFTDPLYDRVAIMLIGKLGNGTTLPLALCLCPVESSPHLVWFILLLRTSGLDVKSVPWFSDRGNLLAAARILKSQHILLSIQFCIEHIIMNVVDWFKIQSSAKPEL